ncbi:MAG: hypothetical protein FJ349_04845 [Sphingomonadales bacterium]|nr:hypothetical protein [Sphingomonadales bacterium]
MNLVNRGFIQVKPKEKLVAWAAEKNSDLLLHADAEATIYLIEEDFWDDDVVLKKYSKKIAQQEFDALGFGQALWPETFQIEDFEAWFACELGCTCIDLLKEPLLKETI